MYRTFTPSAYVMSFWVTDANLDPISGPTKCPHLLVYRSTLPLNKSPHISEAMRTGLAAIPA